MLADVEVIWRVDWAWHVFLKDDSLTWLTNNGCWWEAFIPDPPDPFTCSSVFMTWPLTSPRATDPVETEWKWQWLLGSSLKSSSLHLHNELLILEVSVIQFGSGLHKGMSNRKWESFGASTWKFATTIFLIVQWFISFPRAKCIHSFPKTPPKSHSSPSLTQSLESHLLS